jgi:hypothetical protein
MEQDSSPQLLLTFSAAVYLSSVEVGDRVRPLMICELFRPPAGERSEAAEPLIAASPIDGVFRNA